MLAVIGLAHRLRDAGGPLKGPSHGGHPTQRKRGRARGRRKRPDLAWQRVNPFDTPNDRGLPRRDPAAVRLLSRIGRIMAVLAGAVGLAVLFSWLGGPRFVRGAGQPIEVAPITAMALVLASAALLLGRLHHVVLRVVRVGAALVLTGLSGARLLEVAGAGNLRVDRALGVVHPALASADAHMLPAAAGTLLVSGIAILLLEARRRRTRVAAQAIALAVSPLPLVALVGYAYRVTLVSEGTPATAMALPSSIALLLLVIGIMLARPEEGFVAKLASAGTGSAMARRMLLYAMALPLAIGWLALAMSAASPSAAFAVSVVVVALTLVLVLLVLRDAAALDRMERAKERAQEEQERSREELARALVRERDARAHAEAASNAKDEFLNTLSHELRTPLNAILGWSRLLRDGPPEPARLQRGLAVVERNGRVLAQVVADLLDMSRIARGVIQLEKTEVDLVSTVEAAVEAARPPADAKGVRIARSVGDAVPHVVGDTDRLQQIAWNLLTNAVKFTPPGGRIDVRLSCEDGRAVLSVEDTGVGIGPEYMPHLFERFRQADGSPARAKGGLGLGLALTRELVALHDGTIEAASAGAGMGATFRVSLPRRARRPAGDGGARLGLARRPAPGRRAHPGGGRRGRFARPAAAAPRLLGRGGQRGRLRSRGARGGVPRGARPPGLGHRHARRGRVRAAPDAPSDRGGPRKAGAPGGGAHRVRATGGPPACPRGRLRRARGEAGGTGGAPGHPRGPAPARGGEHPRPSAGRRAAQRPRERFRRGAGAPG